VVSGDSDFKSACEYYSELLYFPSLAAITEGLLAPDHRIDEVRNVLGPEIYKLLNQIRDDFLGLWFFPEDNPKGEVKDVQSDDVELIDLNVISLGDQECTIAFEVDVSYSALVSYEDPNSMIGDRENFLVSRREGMVHDWTEMSSIAKLRFDPPWKSIKEVAALRFDCDEVYVVEKPPIQNRPS